MGMVLLTTEAEGAGVSQRGEEKAVERPHCSLSVLEGSSLIEGR